MLRVFAFTGLLIASAAAAAQQPPAPPVVAPSGQGQQGPIVIAIPPLPPQNRTNAEQGVIGIQVGEMIATDLRSTGRFLPLASTLAKRYSYPEATAPSFAKWRGIGAKALVAGFVQPASEGRITVGCYVYDVTAGVEVGRQGFRVARGDWRRAAHKCAGLAYERLTGEKGMFDSRIGYVAQTGSATFPIKRLAIMEQDGTGHRYLTQGASTVVSPRFSPDGSKLVYVSYADRVPKLRLMDLDSGEDRLLVAGPGMSFAPSFSPDGNRILFSMANGGNTDLYVVDADGGMPQRLTATPGTDTAASFSPDASRIVFESDRSGTQQLYVMNADGLGQRRITFGGAHYASPVWSPSGDRIAFTRIDDRNIRIGVISPTGAGERVLTYGWQDEAPSWAPNGEQILFQRTDPATGRTKLFSVPVGGGAPRALITPTDGSDPVWSGLRS